MNDRYSSVALGEVVQLQQGLAFNKKNNHLMVADGIPLLRITNLIHNTADKFVNADKVDPRFISVPEDIIFTRTGQVGLVFRGKRGIVHNNCFRVIPDKRIDRSYLYWFLRHPETIFQAKTLASGAAQPDLNHDAFKSIMISYPDLPTQKKIAGILSAYDDLIENNLRRIVILEEMAQSLYREWFVHFRFPGHETVELVDSELGKIPEGWEVKELGKIAGVNAESIRKNNAPSSINYIDIKSVSTASIDEVRPIAFSEAPSRARRIVRHGDIIWSTVRPNRRSFSIILDPIENLIASTGFAVLSATDVPFSYLYYATTTEDYTSYLVNHATGAAYPAVNASVFEKSPILIPPNELLEKFNATAESTLTLVSRLHAKNENLRKTRDLLLPKLLSPNT